MLAERLAGLMPDLSTDDSLEVSAVHSLAGLLTGEAELVTRPRSSRRITRRRWPAWSEVARACPGRGDQLRPPGILFIDDSIERAGTLLRRPTAGPVTRAMVPLPRVV